MRALAAEAHAAARRLAGASREQKDAALRAAAGLLLEPQTQERLFAANKQDLEVGRRKGLSAPLLDRLRLDAGTLVRLAEGLRQVVSLADPVGAVISETVRPNGLRLRQVRVPLGTILIIFESRPNVTIEAGSLCLKSGNACILRGGGEATNSNLALAEVLRAALKTAGLPEAAVSVPSVSGHAAVRELLKLDGLIDLVIPRGGEGLIRAVARQSRIPVIKHYQGVCHVYLDRTADPEMARRIVLNAKLQRPATCNAAETLLVHRELAPAVLPALARELAAQGCELVCEPRAKALLASAGLTNIRKADAETFHTEYLDKVLSVAVVGSLEEAVEHIERFGSRHTEAIVTGDAEAGRRFQQSVDSSSVFVNASTRLSDGFEYGLGAEIGISTDKLHARGPMGLESLTTYKWLGDGAGQLRE